MKAVFAFAQNSYIQTLHCQELLFASRHAGSSSCLGSPDNDRSEYSLISAVNGPAAITSKDIFD